MADDKMLRQRRDSCLTAQAAASPAYVALGDSGGAPPALYGEEPLEYRRRLLRPLQSRSKFKDVNLSVIYDEATLSAFECEILKDALASTRDPANFRKGEMRAIRTPDASGRNLTRYIGDANACWDQFNPPIKFARQGLDSFLTPGSHR